jgi:hypothetical protein
MDPDPQRRFPQKKKRPKGHASLLHAADVFRIITERVSVNGPTRVSLRGRALSGPDAVKAVCDAVLELGRQGSWIGNNQTRISPTTTLNLASGNVCPAGLEHLVNLLLDKRCPPQGCARHAAGAHRDARRRRHRGGRKRVRDFSKSDKKVRFPTAFPKSQDCFPIRD